MTTQTTVEINGVALMELRMRTGIAQVALAESAGISRQYLCQIETGARVRVSPVVLANLCDALGIADRRAIMATTPEAVA